MIDFIIKNGLPVRASLLRRPCQNLGVKTTHTIRENMNCETITRQPMYVCCEYDYCTPFGGNISRGEIQPCQGCPQYEAS